MCTSVRRTRAMFFGVSRRVEKRAGVTGGTGRGVRVYVSLCRSDLRLFRDELGRSSVRGREGLGIVKRKLGGHLG